MGKAGSRSITIRDMRKSDLGSLERWYLGLMLHVARTRPQHYRQRLTSRDARWTASEAIRRQRKAHGFFLIAEVGGTPIGFISAAVAGFPPRWARLEERPNLQGFIDDVFVEPGVRSRGVGTALFSAAGERLRAMGCDNLRLWVAAGNEGAREFYRELGFQEHRLGLRKDVAKPPGDWEEVRRRRKRAVRRRPATRRSPRRRRASSTRG